MRIIRLRKKSTDSVKTRKLQILRPIMRFPERTNERTKLERSKSLSPRCGTGRRDPEVWEPREYQISVGRVRGRREEKGREERRRRRRRRRI
jgi:hypothetical protein